MSLSMSWTTFSFQGLGLHIRSGFSQPVVFLVNWKQITKRHKLITTQHTCCFFSQAILSHITAYITISLKQHKHTDGQVDLFF